MLSRWSPVWVLCRAAGIILLSGLAGATLIRFAPGFGIHEQALDPRLSAETLQALERERAGERNPAAFYWHFLTGLARGEAGQSLVFNQPVSRLIRERAPSTIRTVIAGLVLGWAVALLLAAASVLSRRTGAVLISTALSGLLLSVPSAVVATF